MIAKINQFISSGTSPLAKIIQKTAALQQLNQIWHSTLNNELSKHCCVAKHSSNKELLTVIVDNAAWATNLRYAMPDIIKTLRTQPEFNKLIKIRYRLRHDTPAPEPRKRPKDPKAQQQAHMLKEFAAKQREKNET
ncbi:MAG: DUF721 domain-containing protein [Gammaproteobacteria bacterium]|nr:DUF721 domain-containing protein [Gammaproteobacteria bacterium]